MAAVGGSVGVSRGPVEGQEDEELDPREFLRVVMKRWKLMAAIVAAVMGLAIAYLCLAKPVWQASVTVKLPADNAGNPLQELMALSSVSSQADPVVTYTQIAESFNVSIRAAHAVHLMDYPQFASAKDITQAAESLVSGDIVEVSNVKLSDILEFDVKVHDPALAVRLADAWAQAFIEANLDFERVGAGSQHEFIASQLASLKTRLTNGEEALERLSQSQGLVHPEGGTTGGADMAMLDPLLSLQTNVQNLLIEKSELGVRYKPDFPGLKSVDAQYKEALAQLNQQLRKLPVDDMDYARLDREVQADEFIYNLLLQKDLEARIEEHVDNTGIVVVDSALPPDRPVAPRKTLILVLALFIALALSASVALGLERWLDEVSSEAEMQRMSGLPVLAVVSDWRVEAAEGGKHREKPGQRLEDAAGLIHQARMKHGYYGEAFKALRTNLAFTGIDRDLKALGILSANAEEGKTLSNANLALSLAAAGRKVLLVDADLRKPDLHKLFGVQVGKGQGLPSLLSGPSRELEPHLCVGPTPGLWLLPCGAVPPNPAELLGSEAFDAFLRKAKELFDHVIFDTSPVLPVTDAVELALRLDGVVLLARFDRTRRTELRRALETLSMVKAPVVGMMLNGVDMRKYSYTYGYRGRYYRYSEVKK